jgi:hypothetical protein
MSAMGSIILAIDKLYYHIETILLNPQFGLLNQLTMKKLDCTCTAGLITTRINSRDSCGIKTYSE